MSRRQWLLVVVVALGFWLRVSNLEFQGLWRDEVDSLRFAAQPVPEIWRHLVAPGQNGALYFLALRPWLVLAGTSEFALRFFSVAFGVLCIPLAYRVTKRLRRAWCDVALAAALLVATSPYLVWYSQEGRMYTAVTCLVLLSFERLAAAFRHGGRWRWLSYGLVTGASLYVHLAAVLVLPAQALAAAILGRGRQPGERRHTATGLAVLLALCAPLLAWQVPEWLRGSPTGFAFVPLRDVLATLLVSYTLGVVTVLPHGLVVVPLSLAAAPLLLERRVSVLSALAVLGAWLFVPVLALYLVTLRKPMFTARYLVPILPALIVLAAAGIDAAARRLRLLGAVLLACVLALNGSGLWVQSQTPLKADFRGATQFVAQGLEPGDAILFQIPYGRHSFAYYYPEVRCLRTAPESALGYRALLPHVVGQPGQIPWLDAPYTNAGMGPEEVDRLLRASLAGRKAVWLVASEVEMWDARHLAQGWLAQAGLKTAEAQFVGVGVYRYELVSR